MKKVSLVMLAALFLILLHDFPRAQDAGVPDTLYIEVYPGDQVVDLPGPWFVRFPIYVTNDVVDPVTDSIAGFIIPLCYDVSSPGTVDYCSLGVWWNGFSLFDIPGGEVQQNRSIFRHLPSMQDVQIHNQMLDLNSNFINGWDFVVLDLGDQVSHFWFTAVPTGTGDQRWPPGSRSLLATMTFKTSFSDSVQLCIDTCFWPPASRFAFSNSNAETYIPQTFLPVCRNVRVYFWFPPVMNCPHWIHHNSNGHFNSGELTIEYPAGVIMSLDVTFSGEGVENVTLINVGGLGTSYVTADVDYYVTDHCQEGGTVTVTMRDEYGYAESCDFDIILGNDPPHVTAPDTFTTLSDYGTVGFWVSAVDPDGDSIVAFTMDGFWCQSDSLRAPTYAPTFDGNNPGKFLWNPLEADTGNWIALFSAEDICGAVDAEDVVVRVSNIFCGDATGDGAANVGDAVYLLNYLFRAGDPPEPLCKGNVNCDEVVDLADAIYILNRLFKHGPPCCFDCCTGW